MERLAIERSYPTPFANSPLLPLLLISLATQRHTPITRKEFKDEYDFIIVGAGSAGSVLARRLSELFCIDVLLLEAGSDPPLLTEVPATPRSFINTDIDWRFTTVPQRFTAAGHRNRQITYPAGKNLGGSSVHSRISYRGNRQNYDDWAALGAEGWSYEEVLPYFLKLEDHIASRYVENEYHGVGGPMTIETLYLYPNIRNAIEEAVTNLGYRVVDADGPQQTGFAKLQTAARNGQSCSTAKAYLVPSENRTNLDIIKNAMVTKILIEDKEAVGVQFDYEGSSHEVRARREVIVSAGAINSAKLLMLSGIGPVSELIKHKIPLVADLPVGLNFQDHVGAFLPFDISEVMRPFGEQLNARENIEEYIFNRTGPLITPVGCPTASYLNQENSNYMPPDFALCTVFYNLENAKEEVGWSTELLEQLIGPYADKATVLCIAEIVNPQSRGTVRLQSSDPYQPSLLDPNYLEKLEDVQTLVAAMKTCNRIFSSASVENLGIRPFKTAYKGCEDFTENEDLYYRCIARTAVFTFTHGVGTAKMGNPLDPTTVVDPQLRVKTVRGLRIVDASVMPTIPWAGTNIPVIMIAEKASDMIKRTVIC